MLRNIQVYQEGDNTFDAILLDQRRDQILIGGK